MLVWQDTERRGMAQPDWLPTPGHGLVRKHHERGDLLCIGAHNAPLLGWREDVEWVDVGDGWAAALYGSDPDPIGLMKPVGWSLVAQVQDARRRIWQVPAILYPSRARRSRPAWRRIRG